MPLETRAVNSPGLIEHATAVAGLIATIAVIFRYGSDAVLRLLAGITAILARDKRSRARRALDVLRALRSPDALPDDERSER
jgi:hypothetical protein